MAAQVVDLYLVTLKRLERSEATLFAIGFGGSGEGIRRAGGKSALALELYLEVSEFSDILEIDRAALSSDQAVAKEDALGLNSQQPFQVVVDGHFSVVL